MSAPPERPGQSEEEKRGVQLASHGAGRLLQRDFVIVIEGSACTPEQVAQAIRNDFARFSPEELARFTRPAGAAAPLAVGDTMQVRITGAGESGVLVTHVDERSLTMRTLEGHPEAGRITFGAAEDEGGRLVCRIRSRARLRDLPHTIGYELVGKHAQTRVWVTFLERLAQMCGGRVLGGVIISTDEVAETQADRGHQEAPTFTAAQA